MTYLTPNEKVALDCIVCDRKLGNCNMGSPNQPNDGVAFNTHGHYGSTVFDPCDGSMLEISICDQCILKKASTHINHYDAQDPNLGPDEASRYSEVRIIGPEEARAMFGNFVMFEDEDDDDDDLDGFEPPVKTTIH